MVLGAATLIMCSASLPIRSAQMEGAYVYLLASKKKGTLYTGVTKNLTRRVHEHGEGIGSRFSAKYGAKRLVWFENHDAIGTAIVREKTIKKWPRQWKINVIEASNPDWNDLRHQLL